MTTLPLSSHQVGISMTEWLLLILLVLLVAYYYYATSYHGVWENVGVPGPKPWPIIDHKLEIRRHGGLGAAIDRWFRQYGDTFGAYGLHPRVATLVTKDLKLAKQVLVKDFGNFNNRAGIRPLLGSTENGLSAAIDGRWRRQRHVTSSMFTGVKMKMMMTHVTASADTLTKLAQQYLAEDKLVPVKEFTMKFATEVIARIGFGITAHSVSDDESEFAYHSRTFLRIRGFLTKFASEASYFFPPIHSILRYFTSKTDFVNQDSDKYFVNILETTTGERKEERSSKGGSMGKTRDMLDLLMDAEVDKDDPRLKDMNSRTLSHEEVVGNSTILILAGVQTVSITFGSILYCLAHHQDIQDKVVEEIDNVVPPGQTIVYEDLAQLKYTEQVINECMRLFPLITPIFRKTAETKTYDGVTIPKGTIVQIHTGHIMKDPVYWPDPEKFDPERFAPERKSTRDALTFLPFGYGPRLCVGQRLAMMELKVILVSLLREVRFVLSDRTEPKKGETMQMDDVDGFFLQHKKPVQLEIVARH